MILTQRLCVFYYIELTSFLSNQSCRAEAYQLQEENLRTQNTHLAEDYSVWFPTKYPTYIGDTEKLLRALQENERQSLMERRRHLTRIIAKLETERLALCLTNLPDDGDDHYQVIFWNMENIVSIRRYEFVRVASVEILEQRAHGIQQTPAMDSRRKWRRRRKLKL